MIARSTRRCGAELDDLQARPSAAAEHHRRDRGHPDRNAEQQPRAAGEAGGHELHLAAEREVDLDDELRQDRDERHARHRDPGRGVELGCLGGRGEHEGGRHHRAAEDDHAERRRDRSAAEPREHAGQRARRHDRQPALPDRQGRAAWRRWCLRWVPSCDGSRARVALPGGVAARRVRAPVGVRARPVTGRHTGMAAQSDSRTDTRAIRAKSTKTARIANDRMRSGSTAIG